MKPPRFVRPLTQAEQDKVEQLYRKAHKRDRDASAALRDILDESEIHLHPRRVRGTQSQ